jgi:hypothetical protein
MSKKSMSLSVILLVVASLALTACLPGAALAAGGNGNGNGQAGSVNGAPAQNQNCTGSCTATPAQTSSGYGVGNRAGRGARYGTANRRGTGAQAGGGLALGPLSTAEANALVRAIQEETNARALYQHVLDQFGNVAPFSAIVQSEAQHLSVLTNMAAKYDLPVPTFTTGNLPQFTTLAEACQAGVAAEQADAALYDTLIPVTTHADLLQVYRNLQSASLNQHLPAFEACN